MPQRHKYLFTAFRAKLREGYSMRDFRADLMSGMVVGMVALPLGMALAIASGVPPQYGLYTVIVGGGAVALLGGSRYQVSGPTAAFVVILAPVVQKFGLPGLLVAGLLAGVFLVAMGLGRLGQLIEFIPHPVTTGFTSGIAVVIATIQLKDFFGLRLEHSPDRYFERVTALFGARSTFSPSEMAVGILTLLSLIFCSRLVKRIPAPLVVLGGVTVLVAVAKRYFPDVAVATVGSRFSGTIDGVVFHGIPQAPPHFGLPWNFADPAGKPFVLDLRTLEALIPSAFAIAMLGAIESLLSAVVADGMADTRHDPDGELVGLGIGNILCPFFGGIAATGAIARTATNIRFGARSPLSAVIHSLFVLVVVLAFAPYVSYLPMAALAALLMLVAYNMSGLKHFSYIVRVGPRSDVATLMICFGLTVAFDMVIGVTAGVVLAAFLFMRRMSTVTTGQILSSEHLPHLKEALPEGVLYYEIAGPLFFGAADSAVDAISEVRDDAYVVIFDLEDVPVMDVSGLVAFESAVNKLVARRKKVIVAGVRKQPMTLLRKSHILAREETVMLCGTVHEAVQRSRDLMASRSLESVPASGAARR